MRGGAGRTGRRSGLDAGGRLRTMRTSLSRAQPLQIFDRAYLVARQPPGALAERSGSERIAGYSGGASGPCRPGLKSYRKLSPPEMTDTRSSGACWDQTTRVRRIR
jgi:hypothetical protein